MTSFTAVLEQIRKIGTTFEEYKKVNDERIEALEGGDTSGSAEVASKLLKIENDLTKFINIRKQMESDMQDNRERVEALEARASNPKKGPVEKLKSEYSETFFSWVRAKGLDPNLESKMHGIMAKAKNEYKDITIGTPSAGGYAVPEEIARTIERLELKFSPVRRLVKVVQASTSDYKELVSLRGASSGWVGETGSRTATDTPTLREVTPTHGELYAYPQVSEWSLDDIFFNVENWLAEEVAQEFALQEGAAVISGNGVNKPTGLLNTAPVLTDDFASPLRAAAAYEYIPSDSDVEGSPAAPGITGDALITAIYTLNSAYRPNSTWVMNSLTTGAVRKLKTSDGHYHWAPGLQAGQPDRLLGYPVETWEQFPDISLNAFPIAFGNWARAYVLVDRVGLRMTRDNVTNPGFVRFYIRRREGGIILNNDAVKFIRTVG